MASQTHRQAYIIVEMENRDERKGTKTTAKVRIPIQEFSSDIPLYGREYVLTARLSLPWPSDYAAMILQQLELLARAAWPPDKRELAGAHVHTWGNDGKAHVCMLCGQDRVEWLESQVDSLKQRNLSLQGLVDTFNESVRQQNALAAEGGTHIFDMGTVMIDVPAGTDALFPPFNAVSGENRYTFTLPSERPKLTAEARRDFIREFLRDDTPEAEFRATFNQMVADSLTIGPDDTSEESGNEDETIRIGEDEDGGVFQE